MIRRFLSTSAFRLPTKLHGTRERSFVLGIESTFDESGASVIDADNGQVLGASLASVYTRKYATVFGGVVPSVAAAEQDVWLNRVIASAMIESGLKSFGELSAVAVAVGPGLSGCLAQGVRRASFLSRVHQLPVIQVNHLEAHLLSPRLELPLEFPYLALLASGGHTQLVVCRGVGDHEFLGGTLDDAVGEAFDKVARTLGVLGGGATLEKLAARGDPKSIALPLPLTKRANCHFSFTGLKTAVERAFAEAEPADSVYWRAQSGKESNVGSESVVDTQQTNDVKNKFMNLPVLERLEATTRSNDIAELERELPSPMPQSLQVLENPEKQFQTRAPRPLAPEALTTDMAASFQHIAIKHLTSRTLIAVKWCQSRYPEIKSVVLSGGVARNRALIDNLNDAVEKMGMRLLVPAPELCTDNGVMIAWGGVEMLRAGFVDPPLGINDPDLRYFPSMPLQKGDVKMHFAASTTKAMNKFIEQKYNRTQ